MHSDLDRQRTFARQLRELTEEGARPYSFAEFERRARARERASRHTTLARALAAVVIAAVLLALSMRFGGFAPGSWSTAPAREASGGTFAAGESAAAALRAQDMERWLAGLPREPAVVRVGTRAAVTGLEDRIAQVDDLLSVARVEQAQPARLAALQQERARLVGALVQVRYAETLAEASR